MLGVSSFSQHQQSSSSSGSGGEMVNMEQLRKDCWLGIPHKIRPLAWRILSVSFVEFLRIKLFLLRGMYRPMWTDAMRCWSGNETSIGGTWSSTFTPATTSSIKWRFVRWIVVFYYKRKPESGVVELLWRRVVYLGQFCRAEFSQAKCCSGVHKHASFG